eukprot:Seg6.4 transcript_id=Seg6.4/GoldUCD/mRNA.D3Y31 product="Cytochrome c oxidase assembly protein COX20 mitochondrial" protein_id=Seg6.4/GoldUCD/D3Y31
MAGNPGEKGDEAKSWKFNISPSGFKEFLETTPCARNSLLYGVAGGMATGVGTFMFTKHIRRSCDFTVVAFVAVAIGSWEICRYSHWQQRKEIDKTVELLTKYSNTKENENDNPKVT